MQKKKKNEMKKTRTLCIFFSCVFSFIYLFNALEFSLFTSTNAHSNSTIAHVHFTFRIKKKKWITGVSSIAFKWDKLIITSIIYIYAKIKITWSQCQRLPFSLFIYNLQMENIFKKRRCKERKKKKQVVLMDSIPYLSHTKKYDAQVFFFVRFSLHILHAFKTLSSFSCFNLNRPTLSIPIHTLQYHYSISINNRDNRLGSEFLCELNLQSIFKMYEILIDQKSEHFQLKSKLNTIFNTLWYFDCIEIFRLTIKKEISRKKKIVSIRCLYLVELNFSFKKNSLE